MNVGWTSRELFVVAFHIITSSFVYISTVIYLIKLFSLYCLSPHCLCSPFYYYYDECLPILFSRVLLLPCAIIVHLMNVLFFPSFLFLLTLLYLIVSIEFWHCIVFHFHSPMIFQRRIQFFTWINRTRSGYKAILFVKSCFCCLKHIRKELISVCVAQENILCKSW